MGTLKRLPPGIGFVGYGDSPHGDQQVEHQHHAYTVYINNTGTVQRI